MTHEAIALHTAKVVSIQTGRHDKRKGATQRGWPLVWEMGDKCLMYTPHDDETNTDDPNYYYTPHLMTRRVGIKITEDNFDD